MPLTAEDDFGIGLEEGIDKEVSGRRLEQNSNGYYCWRWQLNNVDGNPITYVNSSGNIGYKRGAKHALFEMVDGLVRLVQ